MKVTLENIRELAIEHQCWKAHPTQAPDRYMYVGKFGTQYHFVGHHDGLSIYDKSANEDRLANLYTTYEEACERMRELFIYYIDHLNTHQFKDNPIKIEK